MMSEHLSSSKRDQKSLDKKRMQLLQQKLAFTALTKKLHILKKEKPILSFFFDLWRS